MSKESKAALEKAKKQIEEAVDAETFYERSVLVSEAIRLINVAMEDIDNQGAKRRNKGTKTK